VFQVIEDRRGRTAGCDDLTAGIIDHVAQDVGNSCTKGHDSVVGPATIGDEFPSATDEPIALVLQILIKPDHAAEVIDFTRIGIR